MKICNNDELKLFEDTLEQCEHSSANTLCWCLRLKGISMI